MTRAAAGSTVHDVTCLQGTTAVRNPALTALRLCGSSNIAVGLRRHARVTYAIT
jgi:hypothetical protein